MRLATRNLIAAGALCAIAIPALAGAPDPAQLAERLEADMGGAAFDTARVLHFTWGVERDSQRVVAYEHTWDRWTGDYRVAGVDRESGKPWLAVFNVNSREGGAWLDGEAVTNDELPGHLERAYGRFINDTYWLLMPWKLRDPGVNLAYVDSGKVGDAECDVVELTFGDVGLTSNDRYRAWIDRDGGRMARWSYVLQDEAGEPGSGEPTVWDWTDWNESDPGVWFSHRKVRQGPEGEPAVAIITDGIELHVDPTAEQLAAWFGRQ